MIVTREERVKIAQKEFDEIHEKYLEIEKIYKPIDQQFRESKSKLDFAKKFKNIGDIIDWTESSGNHGRDTDFYKGYVIGFIEDRKIYEVVLIPGGQKTQVPSYCVS